MEEGGKQFRIGGKASEFRRGKGKAEKRKFNIHYSTPNIQSPGGAANLVQW